MIKIAIYVRVSTMMQADRDSLPMQRRDLVNYCQLILHSDSYEIFEDAGFSAKNIDRPAYQRMMVSIRSGEFSHLLVWKLDRISRNLLDFAAMYDELKKLHVTFISLNEQFDTSSAMGEAMLKIILVFAELERKLTSERVTATMISRASSGQWNGGTVPYGYKHENGKFELIEDEAKIVRIMFERFVATKSISGVATYLNTKGLLNRNGLPWQTATVYRIILSTFYAGDLRYNVHSPNAKKPEDEWVIVPDHHPAIFSRDEEAKIQQIAAENRKLVRRGARTRSAFHRLIYCGICGSVMYVMKERPQPDGYVPNRYICRFSRIKANCNNKTIAEPVVGDIVINTINAVIYADRHPDITSPDDLERLMLSLLPNVVSIKGVDDLYHHLSTRGEVNDYVPDAPVSDPAGPDPSIRDEISRQQRALERLQELYLYSDKSMSRTEYMQKREIILAKISELQLLIEKENKNEASDYDLLYMGSNVLLSAVLGTGEKINYRDISKACDQDVLNDYFTHVLQEVTVFRGKVISVTFVNGYSLHFGYEAQ